MNSLGYKEGGRTITRYLELIRKVNIVHGDQNIRSVSFGNCKLGTAFQACNFATLAKLVPQCESLHFSMTRNSGVYEHTGGYTLLHTYFPKLKGLSDSYCLCSPPTNLPQSIPNIEVLNIALAYSGYDDTTLDGFSTHCPKLTKLNLSGHMNFTDDAFIRLLQACPQLTVISIATSYQNPLYSAAYTLGMTMASVAAWEKSPNALLPKASLSFKGYPNINGGNKVVRPKVADALVPAVPYRPPTKKKRKRRTPASYRRGDGIESLNRLMIRFPPYCIEEEAHPPGRLAHTGRSAAFVVSTTKKPNASKTRLTE